MGKVKWSIHQVGGASVGRVSLSRATSKEGPAVGRAEAGAENGMGTTSAALGETKAGAMLDKFGQVSASAMSALTYKRYRKHDAFTIPLPHPTPENQNS